MISSKRLCVMSCLKKDNAMQTIDTSDLVKQEDYNIKIVEIERKIPSHGKYIINLYNIYYY